MVYQYDEHLSWKKKIGFQLPKMLCISCLNVGKLVELSEHHSP